MIQGVGLHRNEIATAIVLIVFLEIVQLFQSRVVIREWLHERPAWQRWSIYYAMSVAFLFLGSFNSSVEFIYFQF